MQCIWTLGYSSAIEKEILPFATTWMSVEGVTLGEMSQRKTESVWCHLRGESKK